MLSRRWTTTHWIGAIEVSTKIIVIYAILVVKALLFYSFIFYLLFFFLFFSASHPLNNNYWDLVWEKGGTQRKSDDDDYNQALFFMLGEKNVWINDLWEKHTERTDSTQISTCCWANSLIIIAIIELNMHTFTKTDKCSYLAEIFLLLNWFHFFIFLQATRCC